MTEWYLASAEPLNDPACAETLLQTLPEDRRTRIRALRRPADQRRSLGAWALLIYALKRHGVLSPRFAYAGGGKPYLVGGEWQFNLSHAGEWVTCALSSAPVGCDLERIRPVPPRLVSRFFAPSEAEAISALPEPQRPDAFFRLWTLKESVMKATGLGLRLLPRTCEIVWDNGVPRLSPAALQAIRSGMDRAAVSSLPAFPALSAFPAPDAFYLFECPCPDGYRAACCSADPTPPALQNVDLGEIALRL